MKKHILELVDIGDYAEYETVTDDNTEKTKVILTESNFRRILSELRSLMRYRSRNITHPTLSTGRGQAEQELDRMRIEWLNRNEITHRSWAASLRGSNNNGE